MRRDLGVERHRRGGRTRHGDLFLHITIIINIFDAINKIRQKIDYTNFCGLLCFLHLALLLLTTTIIIINVVVFDGSDTFMFSFLHYFCDDLNKKCDTYHYCVRQASHLV